MNIEQHVVRNKFGMANNRPDMLERMVDLEIKDSIKEGLLRL